jgi:hypothetical protein
MKIGDRVELTHSILRRTGVRGWIPAGTRATIVDVPKWTLPMLKVRWDDFDSDIYYHAVYFRVVPPLEQLAEVSE